MGAALLPALIAPLIGAAVQSVVAPAPKQTIIEPPPVQPSLSAGNAAQIAANTQAAGQAFGSQMLNSILARAKAQGVPQNELTSIQNKFNTWFAQNQSAISQSLALKAANSTAQAGYQNAIQNANVQTQLQALQGGGGSGLAGFGGALTKGVTGLLGGGYNPSGAYSAPTGGFSTGGDIISGDASDFV
jgi:hypothetical protein